MSYLGYSLIMTALFIVAVLFICHCFTNKVKPGLVLLIEVTAALILVLSVVIPAKFSWLARSIWEVENTKNIPIGIALSQNLDLTKDVTQSAPIQLDVIPTAPIAVELYVWLIGFAVFVILFSVSFVHLWWFIKTQTRQVEFSGKYSDILLLKHRKISVRYSNEKFSPFSSGIFFPKIVLPTWFDELDEEEKRMILTHETIHIKRFDVLSQTLVNFMCCVNWFNPLVWILRRTFIRQVETSCDIKVVDRLDSTSKKKYAELLLRSIEKHHPRLQKTSFGQSSITQRIKNLTNKNRMNQYSPMYGYMLALIILVMLITYIGSIQESPSDLANRTAQMTAADPAIEMEPDPELPPIPKDEYVLGNLKGYHAIDECESVVYTHPWGGWHKNAGEIININAAIKPVRGNPQMVAVSIWDDANDELYIEYCQYTSGTISISTEVEKSSTYRVVLSCISCDPLAVEYIHIF